MQQVEEGVGSRHRIHRTGSFTGERMRIQYRDFHLFFRSQKNVELTHENANPCSEMAVLAFFFTQYGWKRFQCESSLSELTPLPA